MATKVPSGSDLHQFDLNLYPNEASGLLAIENETLLVFHGLDMAFWVVLDEGTVQDCVALAGHCRDARDLG